MEDLRRSGSSLTGGDWPTCLTHDHSRPLDCNHSRKAWWNSLQNEHWVISRNSNSKNWRYLPLIEIWRDCVPATFRRPFSSKEIFSLRGHPVTMIFLFLNSCCIWTGVSSFQALYVNDLIMESAGRAIWSGWPWS
jgi:hypothetical protein